MKRVCAENKTDERKALVDAVCDMLLFHHAAAERDKYLRVSALEVFKRADVAENPVLGVLTDSTGIKEYEVRVVRLVDKAKARSCEHTLDFFTVRNILLTAVCTDKRERFFASLANLHNFGDQRHIFLLFFRQFIRHDNIIRQINAS